MVLVLNLQRIPSLFTTCHLSEKCIVSYFDIRNYREVEALIHSIQPDFIFHLAAQALVRDSVVDPLNTWSTNVMGTANILNSLKSLSKTCACVIVTSDKCYLNNEWVWGYRETDRLVVLTLVHQKLLVNSYFLRSQILILMTS